MLAVVNALISMGEDIYMKTSKGLRPIDISLRLPLRAEIEAFQNSQINRDSEIGGEFVGKHVCYKYLHNFK